MRVLSMEAHTPLHDVHMGITEERLTKRKGVDI
jgi:hypothetical protein